MPFNPLITISGLLYHFGKKYGLDSEVNELSEQIIDLLEILLTNDVYLAFQSGFAAGKILTKLEKEVDSDELNKL